MFADAWKLRQLFNDGQFFERMQRGELRARIDRDNPASLGGQPVRTQSVSYLDGATIVAVVHQYLRPDGSLAASGKPDPKLVVVDGTEYCWDGLPDR